MSKREVRYPSRNWGGYGYPGSGKSTFFASAAKPDVLVVNADGRFDGVEGLVDGKVHYLENRMANLRPDLMMSGVEEAVGKFHSLRTIIVDPVTNIFGYYARQATMASRFNTGNKNKMADHVAKADAMSALKFLVAFGTDIFYVWHLYDHRDAKANEVTSQSISKAELARFQASLNVTLEFKLEKGRYGATVVTARDYNGRRSNTGFTIWDDPDNWWKGGADRLERLIYTSFTGQDQAIKWGMRELGNEDVGEVTDLYQQVKADSAPKTPSDMWVAWVQAVDAYSAGSPKPKPVPVPPVKETASVPANAPNSPPADVINDFDELRPAATGNVTTPPPAPSGEKYGDGMDVAGVDLVNYKIFISKFGYPPHDGRQLTQAILVNSEKGEWHE